MKIISLIPFLAILLFAVLPTTACKGQQTKAQAAIEDHLKNFGLKEVHLDLFHTSPEFPDKAYVGATVTYNYASSEGKLQKEYMGYILKKDGDGWKVEKNVPYSQNAEQAKVYLADRKQ